MRLISLGLTYIITEMRWDRGLWSHVRGFGIETLGQLWAIKEITEELTY